jgi:hypothetical protein
MLPLLLLGQQLLVATPRVLLQPQQQQQPLRLLCLIRLGLGASKYHSRTMMLHLLLLHMLVPLCCSC